MEWLVIVSCCYGGPSPWLFVNTDSRFWPSLSPEPGRNKISGGDALVRIDGPDSVSL